MNPTTAADIAGLSWIGRKIFLKYREQGWSVADASFAALDVACGWRAFVRALLFTPIVLFCALWQMDTMADEWGTRAAALTFVPGLLLIIPTAGIIYCQLVDASLFRRNALYGLFAPIARPFANVGSFWLMSIPFWPLLLVSCVAMSPWF